jgi:1-deoxy-D-xylulose-5-phosphate reductoisomerase
VRAAAPAVDIRTAATWEFFPLDEQAFPAVALARRVGSAGTTYPAVYNAANEVCVESFLDGRIGFLDIVDVLRRVVDDHEPPPGRCSLGDVLAADTWARTRARTMVGVDSAQAGAQGRLG